MTKINLLVFRLWPQLTWHSSYKRRIKVLEILWPSSNFFSNEKVILTNHQWTLWRYMIGEEREKRASAIRNEIRNDTVIMNFGGVWTNGIVYIFGVFHFIQCNIPIFLNWIITFIEIDALRLHYYRKYFSAFFFTLFFFISSKSEEN